MATLNVAETYRIPDAGAIAPGRRADLVVFSDLNRPEAETVFVAGRLAAQDGRLLDSTPLPPPLPCPPAMNLDLNRVDWKIKASGSRIRAIEVIPDQIVTREAVLPPCVRNGLATADRARDLVKLMVIDRHSGKTGFAAAFVTGLGLRSGALASSVAHDSHNLIVAGVDDADMALAAASVVNMGGGLAAVRDNAILATQSLPIGGLMAVDPIQTVRASLDRLIGAARDMGCSLPDPFMTLSFLALPVIPALKLTDHGLIDVGRFEIVDLFID
jgi:adenine deaminase